jgi:hypothetical protein
VAVEVCSIWAMMRSSRRRLAIVLRWRSRLGSRRPAIDLRGRLDLDVSNPATRGTGPDAP